MRPLVLALIWGSLLYSLLYLLPTSDYLKDNFLASALSAIDDTFNKQMGVINIFDNKGNLENAVFRTGKDIDVYDIKAAPSQSERIFAGTNHGLFVSRDKGANWHEFKDAEHLIGPAAKVYKILFDSKGRGFVSVYEKGKGFIYESRDNFFSLNKIFEVEDEAAYALARDGDNLFLGLSDGKLIKYSVSDNKFRALTNFDSAIANLKVENKGNLIFAALKDDGFWVSENGGQSFARAKFLDDYRGANKVNDFLIYPHTKRELALLAQDNSYSRYGMGIYAATDYGLIRSWDFGDTWQVFRSLPSLKPQIRALSLLLNPGEIYAAAPDKVYKSADFGVSWQIFEPAVGSREISVIAPLYDNDRIIVGTKR